MGAITRRPSVILIIAILAALAMLIMAGAEALRWGNGTTIEKGGDWYLGYGDNLWAGRGWRECIPNQTPASWRCITPSEWTAYRLPVYPAYLAALMPVAGDYTPFVARAGQAVMLALTVWLAVHLAGRLAGWPAATLAAALCLAAWSNYPHDGMQLLTEPLYALLITGFAYGIVLHPRRAAWWGLLWGLSLLTRGNLLIATPLLLFLTPTPHRARFALSAAAPVLMWAARNALALGAFVPFSTGSGMVLNGTYNDLARGVQWENSHNVQMVQDVGGGELTQDAEGRRRAVEWLGRHTDPAGVFLQKTLISWVNPFIDRAEWQRGARALGWVFGLGFVLLLIRQGTLQILVWRGWVSAIPRLFTPLQTRILSVALIFAIGLTTNNIIFYSQFRFRQPVEPILFTGGAVWLTVILTKTLKPFPRSRIGN